MKCKRKISAILAGLCCILGGAGAALGAPPNFTRDIQPIFAEKCYQCHGPDAAARKAELRFDQIEAAIDAGVIVPGDAAASAVVVRTGSTDPRVMMPPPKSNKTLSEREKGLLRDWIATGAKHEAHWAFQPVRKPPIPQAGGEGESIGAIDAFVRARLKQEGLAPTREADRESLLRRATFDLTGLPPTLDDLDFFLADKSPNAYEKVVDRLLASP
ncbi:DUF1549 domain-containing protein, partial [Candidatus Sumerlaeota bacterium]|nr:DUF1549 domain-containing protein [Candidatus Sumerlaeota bacterium]